MSDKPNQDVSRETSPAPEADSPAPESNVSRETQREARPADDAPAAPPPQKQENPAAPERSKRSSVYVYLAVLFGAAFLMLLLAYFVQQRNNETTISGLEYDWNLSREELMEENRELEEERAALEAQVAGLETQLMELQQQKEDAETDSFWREKELQGQLESWHDLWALEQNIREEDYERCVQFFRNISISNYYATPDDAAERVEEIYHTLIEDGLLEPDELILP